MSGLPQWQYRSSSFACSICLSLFPTNILTIILTVIPRPSSRPRLIRPTIPYTNALPMGAPHLLNSRTEQPSSTWRLNEVERT